MVRSCDCEQLCDRANNLIGDNRQFITFDPSLKKSKAQTLFRLSSLFLNKKKQLLFIGTDWSTERTRRGGIRFL